MPLDGSEFKFEIDETTKLLIAARERIEQGWCQGVMRRFGHVCAVGALEPDYHAGDAYRAAMKALARAICGAEWVESVVPWNDAPGRTKEDVLKAYDDAIEASLSGSAHP